jgi:lipopolysaccharide export system permease protein
MGLISRYILRSHIAPFLFGTFTVVFLFLFQFLYNHIDKLLGKGLSEWVIIQLIGLNMAWMIVLAVPLGVLFSTLMAFGSMASFHEITIMKASGASLIKMMAPVLIMALLLSGWLFWFNDRVLPEANHKAKTLMGDINRKKPTFAIEAGQFSTQLEGYTILAREVDSLSGILKGVTIYDNTQQKQNIISADTGIMKFNPDYTKIIVNLYSGEAHQFVPRTVADYKIVEFERYQVFIDAQGFAFERTSEKSTARGDREMSIEDMEQIVQRAKDKASEADERLDSLINDHYKHLVTNSKVSQLPEKPLRQNKDTSRTAELQNIDRRLSFFRSRIYSDIFQKKDYERRVMQYNVEIQKKYAIPFACFIFVFVGAPLGIRTKGGNFGISAAITLGFYIFYWACLIGGEKLADRSIISPFFSMWLGNIVVGIIGIILTLKVNNETITIFWKKWFKKTPK